jgi:hypothetical protein
MKEIVFGVIIGGYIDGDFTLYPYGSVFSLPVSLYVVALELVSYITQ